MRSITLSFVILLLAACSASGVDTQPANLGKNSTLGKLHTLIDQPGPITFRKHVAANWSVPLSGLLNLEHPKAVAAGLKDKDEDIQVFVYSLQHPKYGAFIVDSGVSTQFDNPEGSPDISYLVEKAMKFSVLELLLTTEQLAAQLGGIDGVLLTHIHMDHILGLDDLGSNVPVYLGSDDASATAVTHAVTQATTDRLLSNVSFLREWQFDDQGVIDIFGDGSLWAIQSPGHTPGSTAYLARTTQGSQLMLGDATHTRWGWDNGVEAGTYSEDGPLSAISLQNLLELSASHPDMTVHPGHQN